MKTIKTPEGNKELLETHAEQREYAQSIHSKSLYACRFCPINNGWVVEFVTDTYEDADEWWEKQPRSARVYYGHTGKIRHAK